jgi:hypothetical protein
MVKESTMRQIAIVSAFGLACLLQTLASPACAGKPKQFPLDERVPKADFIGIVECETAGAVVARYKVIESCRGPKAGERIAVRLSSVVPAAGQVTGFLCGKRYFVMASQAASPDFYSTQAITSSNPFWWRNLHADYATPSGYGPIGTNPEKHYEAAKAVAAKLPDKAAAPAREPKEFVWKAPELRAPAQAQLDAWRGQLVGKQSKNAASQALEGLLMYEPAPLFRELVGWSPEEKDAKFQTARTQMMWTKASRYAWRCGQEREKNLRLLLTAKEPIVRAAGAVYLCFEDEAAGMKELAKLAKLDGEAGAWAALTLARRGQKDAVPRVLDMFSSPQLLRGERETMMHLQLRMQALVLLSNSAQKSGLPQPDVTGKLKLARADDADSNANWQALRQWWQRHAERLSLHDPWMPVLSKQKLD